jgi:hypothetical protein
MIKVKGDELSLVSRQIYFAKIFATTNNGHEWFVFLYFFLFIFTLNDVISTYKESFDLCKSYL